MTCQKELMAAGKSYPRTCGECGLGPCHKGLTVGVKAIDGGKGAEGVQSPMGWFYRVDRVGDNNPVVYRCKLGEAWERPEVYDIAEFTPAELRFVADVIDASKAKVA
jgi:hypothetical protein